MWFTISFFFGGAPFGDKGIDWITGPAAREIGAKESVDIMLVGCFQKVCAGVNLQNATSDKNEVNGHFQIALVFAHPDNDAVGILVVAKNYLVAGGGILEVHGHGVVN